MGKECEKEYFVGLDMGTSSCGWAVTDTNYNLLRAKGKDMWGVRLFSEADTSADRRMHRVARRRLQREKARIGYLKELFAEEIEKVDVGFYQRLDESKYHLEDKSIKQPYVLFADTNYTDRDYYQEYPTIFHLRKELIDSDKPHDVRLVFLAILNMFKHRGHFLNANLDNEETMGFGELYHSLKVMAKDVLDVDFPDLQNMDELENILASKQYSNSRKFENLLDLLNISKTKMKPQAEMVKLICGLSASIANIFTSDEFDDETKKLKISFGDSNFEEKNEQAEACLSQESYELFLLLKQMHDKGVLANIMKGENGTYPYLSYARVDAYNKHKYDLDVLKRVIKKYAPEQYDKMFRIMQDNNYSAYVGSVNSGKEVVRRGSKRKPADFFDSVKKLVKQMPEDEDTIYILNEIEKESFLPKQLTASNGVIPNQVHKKELCKILNNAEKYLPFLAVKDGKGLSVSEKIVQLFSFQIPYYVGPLCNKDGKGNGWAVRKEEGRVFPWNFEQKIDVKSSAEEFISRMVNHCTYLNGEKVLPKNSLLYEKYMVLNELNNLKLNGSSISVELKQKLYKGLFQKGKKVTKKGLERYLKNEGLLESGAELQVAGIDQDFANTLSNYKKFAEIFEAECLTFEQEQIAEQIIFWSTVYGDSRQFLREKISEEYGDVLNKAQIKRILGLKFKDWGRFSRQFLELAGADKETGEVKTIISRMWNENYTVMELLSNRFTYLEEIENKSSVMEKTLSEIEYEDLEGLYISAPVKRMTWQTILILKELYQIMGYGPKRIFIEMARSPEEEKKRKESRKSKFAALYKNCKEDGIEWAKEIADTDDMRFRSKKLYLYYTQMGRCMYTGQRIEMSELFDDNLYDIDHIYPRHFVKDDSIENNLVLVRKEKNAHKSDTFPIESSIREKQHLWWKTLKDGGFITEEKYRRLTRKEEFTDGELADFVNRQLVETRQGTKVIAELFRQTFKDSEIVYAKSSNVSLFRQNFDLIKCRKVNDFHHAQDAYLNIAVGNTYHVKFTKNPQRFIQEYRKNPEKNSFHMYKLFEHTVRRGNEVAWDAKNRASIGIVKKVMRKNTPIITRMNYEKHGAIAEQTIYSAKDAMKVGGKGYLPVKKTDTKLADTTRYGGYSSFTGTYFFLVEHTIKGKRVRTLEAMPLYLEDYLNTCEKMEAYCRDNLGYVNPEVRLKKIKMYSLIKVDGFCLYLTGRSGNQLLVSNAVEMALGYEDILYIKRISETYEKGYADEQLDSIGYISKERNMKLYRTLVDKHCNTIYKNRPNPVGEKLEGWTENFEKLGLKKQIYVLLQILQLSQLTNMGADLTDIGGVKKTGVSTLNKKISEKKEFKLINQSITGLYESQVDLLTV